MKHRKHRYAGPMVPHNLSPQERAERIIKNGEIKVADLKANFDLGYEKGKADGIAWGYDAAYGSVMVALHREFGFGHDRLARVAMAAADVQINCTTNSEAYYQLVAETGLDLPTMRAYVDSAGLGGAEI